MPEIDVCPQAPPPGRTTLSLPQRPIGATHRVSHRVITRLQRHLLTAVRPLLYTTTPTCDGVLYAHANAPPPFPSDKSFLHLQATASSVILPTCDGEDVLQATASSCILPTCDGEDDSLKLREPFLLGKRCWSDEGLNHNCRDGDYSLYAGNEFPVANDAGTGNDASVHLVDARRRSVAPPLTAWLTLLTALIFCSALGPAIDIQSASPMLKCVWRALCTVLLLLSVVMGRLFWSVYRCKTKHKHVTPDTKTDEQLTANAEPLDVGGMPWRVTFFWTVLGGICMVGYNFGFVMGLELSSVGHVYLLNNTHSIFLVVFKAVCPTMSVSLNEAIGAVIGLSGVAAVMMDGNMVRTEQPQGIQLHDGNALWGDMLALAGSPMAVGYFLVNSMMMQRKMDVVSYSMYLWFTAFLCFTALVPIVDHVIPTLSMDKRTGIFGWMTLEELPMELAVGGICTLLGTLFYCKAMCDFDPLVVSTVMLLEPVIAELFGMVLHIDRTPGWLTLVGALVCIAGAAIVIANSKPPAQQHITSQEALMPRHFTNPQEYNNPASLPLLGPTMV